MSVSNNTAALTPEERLHRAVKIYAGGAIRYAACQIHDTIQASEDEYEDRNDAAEADQSQLDVA